MRLSGLKTNSRFANAVFTWSAPSWVRAATRLGHFDHGNGRRKPGTVM
jgi:hypothetical protein